MSLKSRFPALSLRDVPIAEAAESVGYDCSTWENLQRLIDAVRGPEATVSYPDRWTGPAAFQSSIYPDRWMAAQDPVHNDPSQPLRYACRSMMSSTDVDAIPLPYRLKRRSENFIDLTQDVIKRRKTDMTDQPDNLIDLTGDDDDDNIDDKVLTQASNPKDNKSSLIGSTNASHRAPLYNFTDISAEPRPRRDRRHRLPRTTKAERKRQESLLKLTKEERTRRNLLRVTEERIRGARRRQTQTLFRRIAGRMRATASDVDADRQILRERWEVDDALKDMSVTGALADLNACFERMEDALADAVEVIEERLWDRV